MWPKTFDLRKGRIMDWDDLLFGIPLVGLDFEVIMRIGDIEFFRGPMGSARRVGEKVHFLPNWIALKRSGQNVTLAHTREVSDAPSVHLTSSKPIQLPDKMIVIVGSGIPLFCLHPRGDNFSFETIPKGTTVH